MSSSGYGLVAGLGWVCLSVVAKLGLEVAMSVAEIGQTIGDAHKRVFNDVTERNAKWIKDVVAQQDSHWDNLCEDRTKIYQQPIKEAYKMIESIVNRIQPPSAKLVLEKTDVISADSNSISGNILGNDNIIKEIIKIKTVIEPLQNSHFPVNMVLVEKANLIATGLKDMIYMTTNISIVSSAVEEIKALDSFSQISMSISANVQDYFQETIKQKPRFDKAANELRRSRLGIVLMNEFVMGKKAAEKILEATLEESEAHIDKAVESLVNNGDVENAEKCVKEYDEKLRLCNLAALEYLQETGEKVLNSAEDADRPTKSVNTQNVEQDGSSVEAKTSQPLPRMIQSDENDDSGSGERIR